MKLVNLSIELWVAPDEKSGKLRYAWASKLLASNAAFKLADAVLIFVYPLPVKSEWRADKRDGDAGGDGESNEIIPSKQFNVVSLPFENITIFPKRKENWAPKETIC